MSIVALDDRHEVAVQTEMPQAEFDRLVDDPLPRLAEITVPEVADHDRFAQPKKRRTAWEALFVTLLFHAFLLANLSGWLLETSPASLKPGLDGEVLDMTIHQEIEELVSFELANPDDRELEVREVTNAMSVGLTVVQNAPKFAGAQTAQQVLAEARVDMARMPAYGVPEGLQFDDRRVVKGTTGEQLEQIDSALDRVTWEIAQNLQESRLLVVWLLDGSGSLKTQREAVAKRLRRIYGELGALDNTSLIPRHEKGLLSSVVMFGEKTNFIVKPTDKFDEIQEGIANLPTDSSGVENVFTAIKQTVNLWSSYRSEQHRRIMLITITDEAGDDFGKPHLDAIAICRRFGAKVYVIGPTAPFGQRRGFVPYVAPENGKTYQIPIDLGPEAAMAENVSLPFWFNGPQYDYLSSGFAPFGLARIVSETGGVYFLTNMTTMAGLAPIGTFDEATLRTFAPDYSFGEIEEFAKDVRKHPLRVSVLNAAQLSQKFKIKGAPRLDMRVTANNFRQSATEAQKDVAESQYMLDTMLQAFPPGIEKELDREPSLRWRMAFCLNYGRLLANRARNLEYNSALALMKSSLAEADINTRSNHWIFHPSADVKNSGVASKKGAQLAVDLLNRVVAEAPGTPWAIMAARELQYPFGIRVEERFVAPPPSTAQNKGQPTPQKPRPLFAQEPKKQQPPTPPPKPPVLPKL